MLRKVKKLLKKGQNNKPTAQERFENAIKNSNVDELISSIQDGANVDMDICDYNKINPLNKAIIRGKFDVVKALIENGAKIVTDDNYKIILPTDRYRIDAVPAPYNAFILGRIDILKYLIDQQCINIQAPSLMLYAYAYEYDQYSTGDGYKGTIQMLLDAGAKVDVSSLMHYVIEKGQTKMLQALLDDYEVGIKDIMDALKLAVKIYSTGLIVPRREEVLEKLLISADLKTNGNFSKALQDPDFETKILEFPDVGRKAFEKFKDQKEGEHCAEAFFEILKEKQNPSFFFSWLPREIVDDILTRSLPSNKTVVVQSCVDKMNDFTQQVKEEAASRKASNRCR